MAQHKRLVREGKEAYMPILLDMEPTQLFILFDIDPVEMKSSDASLVDLDSAPDIPFADVKDKKEIVEKFIEALRYIEYADLICRDQDPDPKLLSSPASASKKPRMFLGEQRCLGLAAPEQE